MQDSTKPEVIQLCRFRLASGALRVGCLDAAGAVVDLSIAMVAPTTVGKVQGNWRMSTAGGDFFGNEVYVIVVVGGATATATSGAGTGSTTTATATATATATSTTTTQ